MKRKDEIEQNITVCEQPAVFDRLAPWEQQCIRTYRRNFNHSEDLNDRELETLQRIRNRASPPSLGRSNTPLAGAVVPTKPPTAALEDPFAALSREMALKEAGHGEIEVHGRRIVFQWAKVNSLKRIFDVNKLTEHRTPPPSYAQINEANANQGKLP